MTKKKISGVVTALVTPLLNNEIDWDSLEKLLDFQLQEGVDGFVINGTTAESPSLKIDEVRKIYKFVKERASDKVLILGAGLNSTHKTLALHEELSELKPDAYLDVVPYYNKPTQEGLYQHFKKIAERSNAPIMLYNVPSRTLTSLSLETIKRLGEVKNICGIKEASGDVEFMKDIKKAVPEAWFLMSGDDETSLDFVAFGGEGAISVLSHLIPGVLKKLFQKAKEDHIEASKEFKKYLRLCSLLFVEPNPTPVKWALFNRGIIKTPDCRLPLMSLSEKYFPALKEEIQRL